MTSFILNTVSQIFVVFFVLPSLLLSAEPSASPTGTEPPAYCIEGHPDYNRVKCEAEDIILQHWQQMEERSARQLAYQQNGCACPQKPAGETETQDQKYERLLCEEACGIDSGDVLYEKVIEIHDVCDPFRPEYNKIDCDSLDDLYRWRRLQEHRVMLELQWDSVKHKWQGQGCRCAEVPEVFAPLIYSERQECEKACLTAKEQWEREEERRKKLLQIKIQEMQCDCTSKADMLNGLEAQCNQLCTQATQTEDPIHQWRRKLQEHIILNTNPLTDEGWQQSCDLCDFPEGAGEDPIDRWIRRQCLKVCDGKN